MIRSNTPWRKSALYAMLASVSLVGVSADAKPTPPGLFSFSAGKSALAHPEQAITGRSRAVSINRGQLKSGRFMVDLPGGVSFEAIREHQQNLDQGRYSWSGYANGNKRDRVTIGVSGNAMSATFAHRGRLFKLEPRADGSHLVSEVKASEPAPEHDPVSVAADRAFEKDSSPVAADGGSVMDVLVAYTPRVLSVYGAEGADALIIQAMAEANQAYANSGMSSRLNLVGTVLTNYTESGNMGTDLGRLRGTLDGHMDELHALRDSVGADLVTLIEDEPQYCGIAYRMSSLSAGFASNAFSVVHRTCATGYYSFAHEIGHNQGAHHDPANSGNSIYSYAHGHQEPFGAFRTVMAYNCPGGCSRKDFFSNPDVLHNGEPTGVQGAANNARTIDATAATVASFRAQVSQTNPPAAPSALAALATGQSTIDLDWVDNASDESGFHLERSIDGLNFVQIAALPEDTSEYLDDNLVADTLYNYRIKSWNSAGNSSYSAVAVAATQPAPPPPEELPPTAPANLSAITGGTDRISLNWLDASDNESGFTVERRTDGSNEWATVASVDPDTASYTDSGLQRDTLFHYRVSAFNDEGASAYSNSPSARTDDELYSTQIELAANGYKIRERKRVALTWSGIQGGRIDIYRDGTQIARSIRNRGRANDNLRKRGGGSHSYEVCVANSTECSNTVTVTF